MKTAAVYIRISQDRSGEGLGVARQLEDCRKWAKDNGHTIAEVYEDNDITASGKKVRPSYRRLCADLKEGTRDGVIIWKPDRLHRHPLELEEFISLMEASGAKYAAVMGGMWDLSTSNGRTIARILGAMARQESEDKSERIARKHQQLAEQGKPGGGGARGYGYTAQYELIPAEAKIIREMAERVLAGESLRSLCRDLDARCIPTVKGGTWNTTSLRDILTAPRIAAQREHRGVVVGPAEWKPIVSTAELARLRGFLLDPERRTLRPVRTYFLSGLVKCGRCGSGMTGSASRNRRNSAEKVRRYVCESGNGKPGCGGTMIRAEPLEAFLKEAILHRLESAEMGLALNGINGAEVEGWAQEVEADVLQLGELTEMYTSKDIDAKQWKQASTTIKARIAETEKRIASATGTAALEGVTAKSLRKTWDTLPAQRLKTIVGVLTDSIIIGPGSRSGRYFDTSRVTAEWKA